VNPGLIAWGTKVGGNDAAGGGTGLTGCAGGGVGGAVNPGLIEKVGGNDAAGGGTGLTGCVGRGVGGAVNPGLIAWGTKVGGTGAAGGDTGLTGCTAGGDIRMAGTVSGVGLSGGVVEMDAPSPRPPKGPVISEGRSRCFCVGLRVSELKFNRVRISLSGNTTGNESYSSFTLNRVDAAWRSSPKVILTTPDASWDMILPSAIEMVAWLTSASVSVKRACN
jgi:hypothetical protein